MKFKIVLEWQVVNMKCYPLFMLCNIISFFSCFKQHTKYFILFIYMELQRNITQWYGGQCHGRRGHQHLGAGRVRGGGGQRVSAPAVRLVNIVINFFTTIPLPADNQVHQQYRGRGHPEPGPGQGGGGAGSRSGDRSHQLPQHEVGHQDGVSLCECEWIPDIIFISGTGPTCTGTPTTACCPWRRPACPR